MAGPSNIYTGPVGALEPKIQGLGGNFSVSWIVYGNNTESNVLFTNILQYNGKIVNIEVHNETNVAGFGFLE